VSIASRVLDPRASARTPAAGRGRAAHRLAARVLVAAAALAVGGRALLAAQGATGGVPVAPAPRPAPTTEEWRADLRALAAELPRRHRNAFHTTTPAAFDSAVRALDARIPRLARHEVILELARLVATVGDGHTNVYPTRDAVVGFRALPVAFYLFADGLHVRAAERAHADLVGARVLRVGDATADEAYRRVRPYVGRDNEMGARFFAPHLLAMPEVLHAAGLAPGPDSARLELALGGRRRVVWLRASGPAELMAADTDRSWAARPGWVDARDAAPGPDPLWLRHHPDSVLWWFAAVPGGSAPGAGGGPVVYAQINQVRDGARETFDDFAARLLAFVDSSRAGRLVLDLRLNRGGNGELRAGLVRGLLRRPAINRPGGLVVLMGRSTWSAAQFILDDLERYSDAVFVGEPSGSRGNHYGDSQRWTLPHSGVTVRASSRYWQHWSPDDPRPWTAPLVAAEPTVADYRAKRDPALAAALAYVPAPRLADELRALLAAGDTAGARTRLGAFHADPAHRYVDAGAEARAAGAALYRARDVARAASAFALAADAAPGAAPAQRTLAAVAREAGRPDLERRALARLVALAPDDAAAAARLRALGPP
jgi:hypothetical protein